MTELSTSPRTRWSFEPFELDPWAGRLSRQDRPVSIQAQPLKLLTLLVSRHGSLVTREEIRDFLWGETHVDWEQGIHYAIRQVRQALGDDAEAPRFVETVPGKGYCFIAEVESLEELPAGSRPKTRPRLVPVLGTAVAALVLVFGAIWTSASFKGSTGLWIDGSRERPRILVVPFRDLDEAAEPMLLAEILTEELILGLGRRLGGEMDPLAFETVRRLGDSHHGAEDLAPEYLVEGTVRQIGGGIRVTARLVDVRRGSQLWATAYERHGVLEPPEIARAISEAVGLCLGDTAMRQPPRRVAHNPQADALYNEARQTLAEHLFLYNGDSEDQVYRAHEKLEKAIELEPTIAEYHQLLAHIHAWRRDMQIGPPAGETEAPKRDRRIPDEGFAREHLRIALALDGELESAHLTLGQLALQKDQDLESAAQAVERALSLNPSLPWAHYLHGFLLAVEGRPEAAAESLHRALALSPLDYNLHLAVGRVLFVSRRNREAEMVLKRTRELLDPPYECLSCLHLLRGLALLEGKPEEAVEWSRREMARRREIGEETPRLDAADPAENLKRYRQWRLAPDNEGQCLEIAALLVEAGDHDTAIERLRFESQDREGWYRLLLRLDPRFDPLRDNPGFRRFLAGRVPEEDSPADLEGTRKGAGNHPLPRREATLRSSARPYR